ncbi:uncharacterized protein LOC129776894 [Toxorhynchites rutilus septentrionalis]|uniref:uncharacterized protein LOC129776894 n=1 Tax=Toxorhynchites rutilus septentrionalis TaxID=329112 RepID=UPI0024795CEE|nr:uncharacterized protein LOC129776894 [Toxorhynchites rutilus septentrionalis]
MVEKQYLLIVVFCVVLNKNVALNAIYVNNQKIDKLELDRIKLLNPSEPNVYVTKDSLLTKENFTYPLNYYQYLLGDNLTQREIYSTTTDLPESTTTDIPTTAAVNYADDLSSVENTLNNTTPIYKGDYHVEKRPLTSTSRPAIHLKKPKTRPHTTSSPPPPMKNETKLTKETLDLLRKYFTINCTLTPIQEASTTALPQVTIRKPKTKTKSKPTTTASTAVPLKVVKRPTKPRKTKKHRRPVDYVDPPVIAKIGSVLESVYNYMQDSLVSTEYVSVEEEEDEEEFREAPNEKVVTQFERGKKMKRNSVDSYEGDSVTTQASQLYQPESKQVTFTRLPLVGGVSDNKNKLTTNIQVTSEYTPATPATVPIFPQVPGFGDKDKSSEESESEEDDEGDYYGGFANASYEDDDEESGEEEEDESDEYGESEEGTGNQADHVANDKEYDYEEDDEDRDNVSGKPTKVKKRKPPESLEEYSEEEGDDYDSGESSGNNGGFFSGIMASIGRFVRSFGFGSRRVEEYDDSEEGRSTTPRILELKKRPTRSADNEAQSQIERVHESTEKQQPWYLYPSYLFNEVNEEPEIPIPPIETNPIAEENFSDDWFQFMMPWEFFNPWPAWEDSSTQSPVEVTTVMTTTTTSEAGSGWFPQIFGASGTNEPPPLNSATPKPIIPFLPASDPLQKPETWINALAQHVFTTTRVPRSTTQDPSASYKINYGGHQLWRVYPKTDADIHYLEDYRLSPEGLKLQWWKGPNLRGPNDILVPPGMLQAIGEYLQDEGLAKDVVIRNLGQAILYENPKMTRREQIENEVLHGHPLTWYRYHRYGDIVKFMNHLGRRYPKNVELIHVGRSFEGRPLTVVSVRFEGKGSQVKRSKFVKGKKRLLAKKKRTQRGAVFVEAGAHGREWIGPSVATWMIDALTNAITSNDTEWENMKSMDWYILPVLNPDGYEYSHEYDRMWRKTRSKHLETQSSGVLASALNWFHAQSPLSADSDRVCFGTDLDRNWDHMWNAEGASRSTCSEYYSGNKAFSEPEAKALSRFLLNDRRNIQIFVSLHSYGQTISYPDEKHSESDERHSEVHEMATVAVETLRGSGSHTSYRVERQSEVSGTSAQFARYEAGIKYSYSVELPDTGTHGFLLPPSGIEATARDTLELIKGMVDYI